MDNETPLRPIAYRKPAQTKGCQGHQGYQSRQKDGLGRIIAFFEAFWYYFLHNSIVS